MEMPKTEKARPNRPDGKVLLRFEEAFVTNPGKIKK